MSVLVNERNIEQKTFNQERILMALKISDRQITELQEPSIDDAIWYCRLGEAINNELVETVDHFDFNATEFGKQMWNGFRIEFYGYFCKEGKPREWVNDTLGGDIRNTVVGIVTAITTEYGIELAIALPITALILKTGILKYCAAKPANEIPDQLFLDYIKSLEQAYKKKRKKRKKRRPR